MTPSRVNATQRDNHQCGNDKWSNDGCIGTFNHRLWATVAMDSNTTDAYNVPKWLPAVRRPQLALARRPER
jgi:hypothetical protein